MNRILSASLIAIMFSGSENIPPVRMESLILQARAASQEKARGTIDLSKIGRIASKGRVQDEEYNQLEVIGQLIAEGKESIPFLISQLESEKKVRGRVMNFWYKITVGDLAFIALVDFFTDPTWNGSTIPGLTWAEFLEVEKDSTLDAESQLRNYLSKYGRRQLKAKWERVWDENKERLYWDGKDRCFKLRQ